MNIFEDPMSVDPMSVDPESFTPIYSSCPPPTKPFTDVNPHANPKIEYAFYTKESIQYNANNGEINLERAVNVFSDLTIGDTGIFTVESGSVADVTGSIGQVIEKIITKTSNTTKAIETLKKKIPLLKSILNTGRENVAPAYDFMYNTFVKKLINIDDKNGYMTKDNIKSYFIGPSAIKALLDSGPLGEGVLSAIDNQLCPCFEPLSVNSVDIEDYINIFKSLPREPENTGLDPIIEISRFLDFWITLEYCRVFQLVSSDVLGAINGFIPLRAIIENTGFTGFITIPKGSGGELGVDNKICVYALFLNNVLKGKSQNFFKIPDKSTNKGKYEVLYRQYISLYIEFKELLDKSEEFLNVNRITSNVSIIEFSVKKLMQLLQDKPNGTLHGSSEIKSDKFPVTYNTYKIITLFANFIKTHEGFFQNAIDGLNESYTAADSLIVENSAWITWLCFQLSRYQQTQRVYTVPIETSLNSVEAILSAFEERKQLYCTSLKANRAPFQTAWYKATQQVYINEAFAGHDNKSYELTKTAIQVFEKQREKIDVAWLNQFVQPNKKNPKTGIYSEHSEDVIIKIIRETNCTCFFEAFYIPDNIDIWTVGQKGPSMINDREYDKKKYKLPIHKPTNGLLDIITGQKQEQYTTFIVVDLAKYVPDIISKTRSVDEIKKILQQTTNVDYDEEEQSYIIKVYEESDSSMEEVSAEKNEAAIDLFFRNKLAEQNMLKNFNTGTVYAPIIYSVDAASFKLPSNAVFITGELKIPIDVGNNITMVITFKVGTNDTYSKSLYTRTPAPINPVLLTDVPNDKKDYAICLEYFYKKKNTQDMNIELNNLLRANKFSFKSPQINQNNYSTFLKNLFDSIRTDNNNYQFYLQAAIPNIESLKSKTIFKSNQSVGKLWKKLIYNIAEDDVYVAQAFMRTLKQTKWYEAQKTAIDECEREIDEFITLIKNIQLNYINDTSTATLISAQLQQTMNTKKITFCTCRTDNEGNIVFELATFNELLEEYPVEFKEMEESIRAAQSLMFISTTQIDLSSQNDKVILELDKKSSKRKREEGEETQPKKSKTDILTNEIKNFQMKKEESWNEYLEAFNRGDDEEIIKIHFDLYKNYEKLINKLESKLATTGGGQIGGDDIDEDIKKIEKELAELERKYEEYLIKQVKFTDKSLSELELVKTAVFLGPELFDKIALIQAEEIADIYNKVFTLNVGDIPLGKPINTSDTVLPEGTTIEEFNNKLVTVKFIDGKYYIESAQTFFNTFLENLNTPESLLENVTETAQNVVAKVEEVAEIAVENVEDIANKASIRAKEAISSLTTPIVIDKNIEYKKPVLNISEPPAISYGPPAAAAAGGFKKNTKKQRKRVKKVTKRKNNQIKLNKKVTKRKRGGKKSKKTKRRNLHP